MSSSTALTTIGRIGGYKDQLQLSVIAVRGHRDRARPEAYTHSLAAADFHGHSPSVFIN